MHGILTLIIGTALLSVPIQALAETATALTGRVLDEETRKGVEDVQVVAELGTWEYHGVTDDRGRYLITDLMPGMYALRFIPTGTPHVIPAKSQTEVSARKGKRTEAPDVFLPRGFSVQGTVLTERRNVAEPLQNAVVEFAIPEPRPDWGQRYGSVLTDETGGFLFSGLPATKEFILSVRVNGHADMRKVVALDRRKNVEKLTFTINESDPSGIRGVVRSFPDQRGICDAQVLLKDGNGEPVGQADTNENGEFSLIGVAPGEYTAAAFWPGCEPISKTIEISKGTSLELNFEFGKRE